MKSLFLALFACILFVPIQAQAQFADWEMNHFHSEITINEDGSILVQEIILADFGIREKHGIFRFVPVVYETLTGDRQRIELEFIEFEMDNAPVPYSTYRSGANEGVQLGDPNKTISGEHVYEVSYTIDRALLYFDEHDELYWNVTGNDSEARVLASSAVVHLPGEAEAVQASCYSGGLGATEACGFAQEGNTLVFTAEDEMTIAVGFEKGFVPVPTWQDRIGWIISDNILGFWPLLILLFVAGYWFVTGRDPKSGKTVIAQYDAPNDLWAVYGGILERGRFHRRDVITMIVSLAVRGYLKIEVKGTKRQTHAFIRLKQTDDLDDAHAYVYNRIFTKANLRATFSEVRPRFGAKTRHVLQEKLKTELENKGYFAKRTWMHVRVLGMVAIALFGYVFLLWAFIGLIGSIVTILSGVGIVVFALISSKTSKEGAEARWHLKGLRLFLKTAERYRIEWQEKELEFVKLLPYAIAFGMTKYWAKAFAAIHGEEDVDLFFLQASAMSMMSLEKSLTSLTHAVGTASSGPPPAPSSSGSTGGGFSGGGFGGGGVGSW